MSTTVTRWMIVRAGSRSRGTFGLCTPCQQRLYTRDVVKENDVILLKEKKAPTKKGRDTSDPILTPPLQNGPRKFETRRGNIEERSLIGKGIRDSITTSKGIEYRIHRPTLGEYVRFTPRILTPIYPQDANLIVSLLDLHPTFQIQDGADDQPLEIFEAGTGHGSLTLHLARAIHAANPPAPKIPAKKVKALRKPNQSLEIPTETPASSLPILNSVEEDATFADADKAAIKAAYEAYLPTRRAIIQTLDITPRHSSHAQDVVRNFRHGLYFPDIDFHTGTIPEYLSSRLEVHPDPFLTHAILDLPGPQEYFEIVSRAIKPDGTLLVFCPSITQIVRCVKGIKEDFLPLLLESVLEIGVGAGAGGREWDVRLVKPRALLKAEVAPLITEPDDEGSDSSKGEGTGEEVDVSIAVESSDSGWEVICRPKVHSRVIGGGFVGVFRRMEKGL